MSMKLKKIQSIVNRLEEEVEQRLDQNIATDFFGKNPHELDRLRSSIRMIHAMQFLLDHPDYHEDILMEAINDMCFGNREESTLLAVCSSRKTA